MKNHFTNYAALVLLLAGLLQMTGDLMHWSALKGIGAATLISPAPKVFTSVRGYEAYSTRFFLEWEDHQGNLHSLPLTPENYARVAGPYNRRNVYGAVIAGGPLLATDEKLQPMFEAVTRYAVCDSAVLLRELGIDRSQISGRLRVRYEPLPGTAMQGLPQVLEVLCP
jgi:hypothetical protein